MPLADSPADSAAVKRLLSGAKSAAKSKGLISSRKAVQLYEEAIRACDALEGKCEPTLKVLAHEGLAKVQFKQGQYHISFKHCMLAMEVAGDAATASLHTQAAKAALLMGAVSTAMKYATRALVLKPQDADAKHVIKDCNLEIEYEAQVEALMEGEAKSSRYAGSMASQVGSLVTCLSSQDAKDAGKNLAKLSRATSSSVEAQLSFHVNYGFKVVMPYFNETHFNAVASVLVAAGSCKVASMPKPLPTKGGGSSTKTSEQKHHKKAVDAASMAACLVAVAADNAEGRSGLGSGAVGGLEGVMRVRWPQMVLEHLTQVVESEASPALIECAIQLLAYAARDPIHRQLGLCAPLHSTEDADGAKTPAEEDSKAQTVPVKVEGGEVETNPHTASGGVKSLDMWPGVSALGTVVASGLHGKEQGTALQGRGEAASSIIMRILTVIDKAAGWIERLPPYGVLALSKLFLSLALDKQSRQLLPAAGKPLAGLLKVYHSMSHQGSPPPADADSPIKGSSSRPPCCVAAHNVVTTLLVLCSLDHHLLAAEGFSEKVAPVRKAAATLALQRGVVAAGPPKMLPTPLLGSMVMELKQLLNSSPVAAIPELDWDGESSSFMEGKIPADPCCPSKSLSATANGSQEMQLHAHQQGGMSLVETWFHVLASAACAGGTPVAKELYRVDATLLAKEASNLFRTSPNIMATAERLYCALANLCPAAAQDICKSGCVPGLLGIVLGGGNGVPPAAATADAAPQENAVSRALAALTGPDGKALALAVDDIISGGLDNCGSRGYSSVSSFRSGSFTARGAAAACTLPGGPSSSIRALTGSVGIDADLALKAVDRLATVLDACKGHDFMRIVRLGGPLAASYEIVQGSRPTVPVQSPSISRSSAADGAFVALGYWEAAVQSVGSEARSPRLQSAIGGAAGTKRSNPLSTGLSASTLLKEQQAFWDAARCLVIGCMERSQKMSKLSSEQVPRFGFWGSVPAPKLLSMEKHLRQQWCDFMLPVPSKAAREASSRVLVATSLALASANSGSTTLSSKFKSDSAPAPQPPRASEQVPAKVPESSGGEPMVELPPSLMPPPKPGAKKLVQKSPSKAPSPAQGVGFKVVKNAEAAVSDPVPKAAGHDLVAVVALENTLANWATCRPSSPSGTVTVAASISTKGESSQQEVDQACADTAEEVNTTQSGSQDPQMESAQPSGNQKDSPHELAETGVVVEAPQEEKKSASREASLGEASHTDEAKVPVQSPTHPEKSMHAARPPSASQLRTSLQSRTSESGSSQEVGSSFASTSGAQSIAGEPGVQSSMNGSLRPQLSSYRRSISSTQLSASVANGGCVSSKMEASSASESGADVQATRARPNSAKFPAVSGIDVKTTLSRPTSAKVPSSTSLRPSSGISASSRNLVVSMSHGALDHLPTTESAGNAEDGHPLLYSFHQREVRPRHSSDGASLSNSPLSSPRTSSSARRHSLLQPGDKRVGRASHGGKLLSPRAGPPADKFHSGDISSDFDDGVLGDRDSSLSAEVRQARAAWTALPLHAQIKWSQKPTDVMVEILLPKGTTKRDVSVSVQNAHLNVNLKWFGKVVKGTMPHKVREPDALWTVRAAGANRTFDAVHILMPKADESFWRSLFVKDEQED